MKKLLILSGKGGTGKTTVAAAFVRLSGSGAVADCDVDAPNLHLVPFTDAKPSVSDFLGGEKAVIDPEKCTGCGLCAEKCRFSAVMRKDEVPYVDEFACEGCGVCAEFCPSGAVSLQTDVAGRKELFLGDRVFSTAKLRMGRGNSGKLVTEVKSAMLKNAPDGGIAVIDGSPGIGCPVIASVSGVDLVLAVAEPSISGLSDLERLLGTVRSFGTSLAVCVNKWDLSPENTESVESFCREQGIPFVGRIPYDPEAAAAVNRGASVVDTDCPAGRAIRFIFSNTVGLLDP